MRWSSGFRFIISFLFLARAAGFSQSAANAQVFVEPAKTKVCTDNEVVVASQHGGPGVLTTLNRRNGAWAERIVSNVPVRIESIDIGKIKGNVNSIVAGLEHSYPGSTGAVRVYSYNLAQQNWGEESLGAGITNNIEAIAAQDLDGDGKAEIIAGLEGSAYESRIRVYHYNQGWTEELPAPLNYQHDIQYVSVVDLYGNGQKWIVALVGDWTVGPSYMELRAFRKVGATWTSQLLASNVANFPRAERFLAANLDSDPEAEILVGMWDGSTMYGGGLYMLDFDGSAWQTIAMNPLGVIDGLGIGNFSSTATKDVLVGTWRNVVLYTRPGGAWIPQTVIPNTGAYMTWDADFGFLRELGNIGLVALDQRLQMLRYINGTIDVSTIKTFPYRIDSVQVGDVDGLASSCEALPVASSAVALAGTALVDGPP